MNDIRFLSLTNGGFAVVDADMFEELNRTGWQRNPRDGYIQRSITKPNGKRGTEKMHRLVNKTPSGFQTDHKDRVRFDNTRRNLETVSDNQNKWNMATAGAYLNPRLKFKRWRAVIGHFGKTLHLGYFHTRLEARLAYCEAAWFLHGRFAARDFVNK